MLRRMLWDNREIPALGMGCWAIGGPFFAGDQALGWGETDDRESVKAIHAAYNAGIRFFDTSDAYGTGHSESLLGEALSSKPDVIIATKFGNTYDSNLKQLTGMNVTPEYIHEALEQSRFRLKVDKIPLYQLHVDTLQEGSEAAYDTLLSLRNDHKIDAFGWSTDSLDQAKKWKRGEGFKAVQHAMNLFQPAPKLVKFCDQENMLSINRSPLAMGLLSGKFDGKVTLDPKDIRSTPPEWLPFFQDGIPKPEFSKALDHIRELMTSGGRSLVQGALGWIWAKNPRSLPIPGFRTVKQVEENVKALDFGPLPENVVEEMNKLLLNFYRR